MRCTSILVALLAAFAWSSAWAAGTSTTNSLTQAPASTNQFPLPPPPPTSLNPIGHGNNTVPPTPAPATAGLPSPTVSPALPSSTGLPATTQNELRPSPSLSSDQVASVQASLAAGGLYRGPIDGNMSASFRAALREYQGLIGIPQTGNIDAETMQRLQMSALSGAVGSNGTTTTVGNRGAAGDPFSTNTPLTGGGTQTGTTPTPTPFQLSTPINTNPNNGANVTVQP